MLYAAYADSGATIAGHTATPVEYQITISFVHVRNDDCWEDLIGDISAALDKFVLWEQLGSVFVTLQSVGLPARGSFTWEL